MNFRRIVSRRPAVLGNSSSQAIPARVHAWLTLAVTLVCVGPLASSAAAQSAVLVETYGRGVHAYFSHDNARSYDLLSMAINAGLKDPLAYYFRGLAAHSSGRSYEAEADWQMGAELEAKLGGGPEIGRALARIQGPVRLELERIREAGRLQALSLSLDRSQTRYGELGVAPATPGRAASPPPAGLARPRAVTPPPAPASDNPFADDPVGEPIVESDDALADAMKNPMAQDAKPPKAAAEPATADPFGAPAPAAADPFGAPAMDDPFGAPAGGSDPFGADPFGS